VICLLSLHDFMNSDTLKEVATQVSSANECPNSIHFESQLGAAVGDPEKQTYQYVQMFTRLDI